MPIYQYGDLNTTALRVPNLYVQIVPPRTLVLNGVPTDGLGIVGVASWGPVNHRVIVGNPTELVSSFGPVGNRKYDLATGAVISMLEGAQNLSLVRVTDGTDKAATVSIGAGTPAALTVNAMYTGSVGNGITFSLSAGSAANTYDVTVTLPGYRPEVYRGIGGTGATFWQNVVNALTNGTGPLRGPSKIVTATAPGGTDAPTAETVSLAGGTDGASAATAKTLVGADAVIGAGAVSASGMYALRNSGVSVAFLQDADDSTTWAEQTAFGLSEGVYMILTGPAGDTITNAISVKQAAGIDSYASKLMFGDWIFWNDQTNGIVRLVSPQAATAGKLVSLTPNQSSLNKQLLSVLGSQRGGAPGGALAGTYSNAELSALFSAGIDVIANPAPGGNYWAVRGGFNTSSNLAVNGDNYTRMTNYLAATLNAGMGGYVGQDITLDLLRRIRGTLLGFLSGLVDQKLLSRQIANNQLPFTVICDATNNPPDRTALGYVEADVAIRYQAINSNFIVNLEGGQTVTIAQKA